MIKKKIFETIHYKFCKIIEKIQYYRKKLLFAGFVKTKISGSSQYFFNSLIASLRALDFYPKKCQENQKKRKEKDKENVKKNEKEREGRRSQNESCYCTFFHIKTNKICSQVPRF